MKCGSVLEAKIQENGVQCSVHSQNKLYSIPWPLWHNGSVGNDSMLLEEINDTTTNACEP